MKFSLSYIFILSVFFSLSVRADVRLLNHLELPLTMETSTSVFSRGSEVRKIYDEHINVIPKKGDMSEFSTAYLNFQTKYAASFCGSMIQKDKNKSPVDRWVHQKIDFTKAVVDLTEDEYFYLLEEYAEIFWQRQLSLNEANVFKNQFSMFKTFFQGQGQMDQFLLMNCITFAGSFAFLTN